MREVLVSDEVMDKVSNLRIYLIEQLKLSREAAHKRTDRIDSFLLSLAKEVFEYGVIVKDMSHTSLLTE